MGTGLGRYIIIFAMSIGPQLNFRQVVDHSGGDITIETSKSTANIRFKESLKQSPLSLKAMEQSIVNGFSANYRSGSSSFCAYLELIGKELHSHASSLSIDFSTTKTALNLVKVIFARSCDALEIKPDVTEHSLQLRLPTRKVSLI